MRQTDPYLSVIVTSRNDNHGGTLLRRMQTFTNSFIRQCQRHGLSAELIIVEWNPPADRPPLAQALCWPADTSPCQVRIIEVPPEVHQRFPHAEALPLFQMIAKNVGFRRARGRFLLATNIDILFSDELMEFLAGHQLRSGAMYRIDRLDVSTDVPVDAPVPEQLAYCRTHHLRNNARLGTIKLTPEGETCSGNVVEATGVTLEDGWCGLEHWATEPPFIWATPGAEVHVYSAKGGISFLGLEIEPGPCLRFQLFTLVVRDAENRTVARGTVKYRQQVVLRLPLPPGQTQVLRLDAEEEPVPMERDSRTLLFRLFHCSWEERLPGPVHSSDHGSFNFGIREVGRLEPNDVASLNTGIRFGQQWEGVCRNEEGNHRWAPAGADLVIRPPTEASQALVLDLQPGPGVNWQPFELQLFDALGKLVDQAPVNHRYRQEVALVLPPSPLGQRCDYQLRVAGGGTPGSPEHRALAFRVYGCRWEAWTKQQLQLGRIGRRLLRVSGLWRLTKPWRVARRLVGADWAKHGAASASLGLTQNPNEAAQALAGETAPRANDSPVIPPPPPLPDRKFCYPVLLHTMACGDFTLMAREHWFDLRGYPEWPIYSLHIDTMWCYMAFHAGIEEEILRPPMRIYHIEHSIGSGATPEGIGLLVERMRAKGIPCLEFAEVADWAIWMRSTGKTVIVNDESWGLQGEQLRETIVGASEGAASSSGRLAS